MEPIQSSGEIIASKLAQKVADAGKTKGERMAEELTVIRSSRELPASVHRAYATLELANKERAAEIVKIIRNLK